MRTHRMIILDLRVGFVGVAMRTKLQFNADSAIALRCQGVPEQSYSIKLEGIRPWFDTVSDRDSGCLIAPSDAAKQ